MRYVFFLGRTPALSLAEIQALLITFKLKHKIVLLDPALVILDIEEDFSLRDLFVQMGGTPKAGVVIGPVSESGLRAAAADEIRKLLAQSPSKKSVGYSIYCTKNEHEDKARHLELLMRDALSKLKRDELKDVSLRVVYPDEERVDLSTATVFNNRLADSRKGLELDIVCHQGKLILCKTLAVQDIKSYSARDYGKPGREAHIGMMPPKLAQAMLNLAQLKPGQTVFDPFCGTGTILQEALLDDFRAIGSDANGEQVERCKKNLEWLGKQYVLTHPGYKIFQAGFGEAARKLKSDSVDAIVTESTLGPVYKKAPGAQEVRDNYANLHKLLSRFLQSVKPVLRNRGRMVITLPAYQLRPKEYVFGDFVDSLEKLGYSRVCPLDKEFTNADIRITKRNTIIYSRPAQIVAREIVIFENNK